MPEESVFLCYVRHIFKKWVGFQAAIDAGMGGPEARSKEIWLGDEVENYFKSFADKSPEDFEDYLNEMLDNEFDTYFEDGSLREISLNFFNAYELSLCNPNAELFKESKEMQNSTLHERNQFSQSNSEGSEEVHTVTKGIEQLTVNGEDEGWTTVTKRNRHPK